MERQDVPAAAHARQHKDSTQPHRKKNRPLLGVHGAEHGWFHALTNPRSVNDVPEHLLTIFQVSTGTDRPTLSCGAAHPTSVFVQAEARRLSTMNNRTILMLLDAERQTIADIDFTLEKTPYVVRAIGKEESRSGIVYSHFSIPEAEKVINDEIDYFARLERGFEWKVYSHDEPRDLLERLRSRGFKSGEEEALMVLDLQQLPSGLLAPAPEGITVRAVADDQGISHFLALETAIWGRSTTTREFLMLSISDQLQRNRAFVAYTDQKPVGFGRVTSFPHSCFAGLWGGSVLSDFRGGGVYRALLSARIRHAQRSDSVRYLQVDALPTSRPILERYGFKRVASTWPAEWPPI
jgi:GNAT superfamily N-acetyltransferase